MVQLKAGKKKCSSQKKYPETDAPTKLQMNADKANSTVAISIAKASLKGYLFDRTTKMLAATRLSVNRASIAVSGQG